MKSDISQDDIPADQKYRQDKKRGASQSDKNSIAKHRAEAEAYKSI